MSRYKVNLTLEIGSENVHPLSPLNEHLVKQYVAWWVGRFALSHKIGKIERVNGGHTRGEKRETGNSEVKTEQDLLTAVGQVMSGRRRFGGKEEEKGGLGEEKRA